MGRAWGQRQELKGKPGGTGSLAKASESVRSFSVPEPGTSSDVDIAFAKCQVGRCVFSLAHQGRITFVHFYKERTVTSQGLQPSHFALSFYQQYLFTKGSQVPEKQSLPSKSF